MSSLELEKIAKKVRRHIIEISNKAGVGHIGSALSITDILTVLYFSVMEIDPKNPENDSRDRFILSKGHASAALYSTLHEKGILTKKELYSYCEDGGLFPEHPETHIRGVEVTTGSLGHGLSLGVGAALAGRGRYRSFVLLSDGECDEGSTWEAALSASQFRLDNLVAVIDYNKFQAFGRIKDVMDLEPFARKWESFGWLVQEIDGNSVSELDKVLSATPFKKSSPSIVIAHTLIGKGISFMEDKLEWHYNTMKPEQYKDAVSEMDSQ